MPAQSFAVLLMLFLVGGALASVSSGAGAAVGTGVGLFVVLLYCNRLENRDNADARRANKPKARKKK